MGYSSDIKAYKLYNLILDKLVMSTNVKVDDERSHQTNQNSKETKGRIEDEYLEEEQHEEEQEEEQT